jgi:hypothetical protein
VNCATAAGDTVIVKAGTYTEAVTTWPASGSSGNPITVKANPGDTVRWVAPGTDPASFTGIANIINRSYIRIEGFRIEGARTQVTLRIQNTVSKTTNPIQGIEIVNNTFVDNGHNALSGGDATFTILTKHLGRDSTYSGPPVNFITGNTFTNNYGFHIGLNGSSDVHMANNTFIGGRGSKNLVNANWFNATYVFATQDSLGGTTYPERNLIELNTMSSISKDTYIASAGGTIEATGVRFDVGPRNNTIQNNVIHDFVYDGSWNSTERSFGIFLENNSNNNLVRQNIVYNIGEACYASGSQPTPVTNGNQFLNNTGYHCDKVGMWLPHAKNAIIRNNILFDNGIQSGAQVVVESPSVTAGGNVFSHNDYVRTGSSLIGLWNVASHGAANLTLSQWSNASGDTNSMSANPLFVNASSGDFRLCAGPGNPVASCTVKSPAIDAGMNVGLPYNGSAPDMGALESGVAGTTYYVATTGNDATTCAQATNPATPKRTIQAGVNCATSAGDIVDVMGGTYTEEITISGHSRDGAAGNPKIIRAHNSTPTSGGDLVTWTTLGAAPCGLTGTALRFVDTSYWRLQGFTFSNIQHNRAIWAVNSGSKTTSSVTSVVGIEIINNAFNAVGTDGYDGVSSGCMASPIILEKTGYDNTYSGATVNLIQNNTFDQSYGEMIHLDRSSDTLIDNNMATNLLGSRNSSNGNLYQTAFVGAGDTTTRRNMIQNNTIGPINPYTPPISPLGFEMTGIRFDVGTFQNIVQDNIIKDIYASMPVSETTHGAYGIFMENNSNENIVRRNIFYNIGFRGALDGGYFNNP